MQRSLRKFPRPRLACRRTLPSVFQRHVSLTGAIERGIRHGKKSVEERERGQYDGYGHVQRDSTRWRLTGRDGNSTFEPNNNRHSTNKLLDADEKKVSSTEAPRSVPYTHASSEFIYGTFAVRAALKAHRRHLFKLYIASDETRTNDMIDKSLARKAENQGVEVLHVSGSNWKQLMLQMSDGRAHNGYILEASRLPVVPVSSLGKIEDEDMDFRVRQLNEMREDWESHGDLESRERSGLFRRKSKRRFPLLLFLDRITDTGNLGAIMRSAYYFGVEGVVILEHGTAPLNAITVKSSAGAAEHLQIFRVKDERKFVRESQRNGWHFVAAVAPERVRGSHRRRGKDETEASPPHALTSAPTVLMLGNEGTGLREHLERLADSRLSILDAQHRHDGVDSLNVSVAAAILMRDLLRPTLEPGSA